jgi:hypothetical protein
MIDIVVAYDRASARVLEQFVFHDEPKAAFTKRLEQERAYRERGDVEVVLVSARSFDDLKKSHARYFDPRSISPATVKLLSEKLTQGRIAS